MVEIDPRVEAVLDPRAARRLVQLELSDVDVPKRPGEPEVALFVRVLAAGEARIRVELWERGEENGARWVSGARGGSQLIARRVALAAGELARSLRQRRRAQERTLALERRRRTLLEQAERERTLDGPRALRPALALVLVGPGDLTLFGPSITGQTHVWSGTRVDWGAALTFGGLSDSSATAESFELGFGPARRVPFASLGLDLDLSAFAKAGMLTLNDVSGLARVPGERQTLWARVGLGVALELRLLRTTRLSWGFDAGTIVRRIAVTLDDGRERSVGGLFLGTTLGVVLTPPASAR